VKGARAKEFEALTEDEITHLEEKFREIIDLDS
jgi:hypothetical protein